MKTNVNIIRKLNDFEVVQRTKDSMFNATELLKQYNQENNTGKEINSFLKTKKTIEYITALSEAEETDTQKIVSVSRGGNKGTQGTWMHPYLFIDFAMWINPTFKVSVIKFVYDELIKHRHLSGDYYNKLSSLLSRFSDTNYPEVGKVLNYVVFNDHKKHKRNSATPEEQNDLQQLERDMCQYIEMGFITSFSHFKAIMRKEWRKRHAKEPSIFLQEKN